MRDYRSFFSKIFWAVLSCLPFASCADSVPDMVCLYAQPNYQGTEYCYTYHEHNTAIQNIPSVIGSIRLYGKSYITAYETGNFGGRSTVVFANTFDLEDNKSSIHSFKIGVREEGRAFACLFPGKNFAGLPFCRNTEAITHGDSVMKLHTFLDRAKAPASLFISGDATVYLSATTRHQMTQLHSTSTLKPLTNYWNGVYLFRFHVKKKETSNVEKVLKMQQTLNYKLPILDTQWVSASHLYDQQQRNGSLERSLNLVEQLDMGVRYVTINLQDHQESASACTTTDCRVSVSAALRHQLGEIDNWFKANPQRKDFIIIALDNPYHSDDSIDYAPLQQDIEWFNSEQTYTTQEDCKVGATIHIQRLLNENKHFLFYMHSEQSEAICLSGKDIATGFRTPYERESDDNSVFENTKADLQSTTKESHGILYNLFLLRVVDKLFDHFMHPKDLSIPKGLESNSVTTLPLDQNMFNDARYAQLWMMDPTDAMPKDNMPLFITAQQDLYYFSGDKRHYELHYACKFPLGTWAVTKTMGNYNVNAGNQACASEFPGSRFAMPMNIVEAQLLRDALPRGVDKAFVSAHITTHGNLEFND